MTRAIRRALLVLVFVAGNSAADYKVEPVASGLSYPWAMAFLPDGDMLVTERTGALNRISHGTMRTTPIANVPDVFFGGQGGLLDIALDPDFSETQRLYLSFAHGTPGANATRVVSARLADNALVDVEVIFTAVPAKDTPHHYAGRLALMPDGTLLIAVGEGFDFRAKAQSLDNHFGKLVRIHTDGSVPSDNPFVGHDNALPEIWSFGHRNPQGLLVSADSTVWLHEHGPQGGDELNVIEAGNNYGWPAITYGIDYSGAYVSPFTEAEGMQQPVIHWTPSIAPAGIAEYQGDAFPEWRGNLFVAALVEKSVRRLTMKGRAVETQETLFLELDQRIRDVKAGPDGNLYLLTDAAEGQLLKVSPATTH